MPNKQDNTGNQIVSFLFMKEGTQKNPRGFFFLYCGEIQKILLKSVVETGPK